MAIEINGTTVIDNSRVLQNIAGANGVYNNFHPVSTPITSVINFSTPCMTLSMSGNVSFTESNKSVGRSAVLILDTRTIINTISVEYLILAGGASGGFEGGGGGAGGLLQGSMSITLGSTYSFSVGAGGAAITSNVTRGSNGGNSSGLGMTATGGGGGGTNRGSTHPDRHGIAGGSGGGASAQNSVGDGGTGISGQGNAGGTATNWGTNTRRSRGGGGAGAAGVSGTGSALGTGGSGLTSSITGLAYAGGGGGNNGTDTGRAAGGSGVGGDGGGNTVTGFPPTSAGANSIGGNGIVNRGGGGGGGVGSGAGGSGVVILKYPNTITFNFPGFTTTTTSSSGYKITTITGGAGNITLGESTVITYTPTFSSNIKWQNGITPTWANYQYWQISFVCWDGSTVRAIAAGYDA